MMNIPLTNPLMTMGFPVWSGLAIEVAWGLTGVGLVLAVVILAVGVVAHFERPGRRRLIQRRTRSPQIAAPSLVARGAHR
jgi:hypothetical protein